MGVPVMKIAEHPSYFATEKRHSRDEWKACVVDETKLAHLGFTPSNECVSVRFVDKHDIKNMNLFICVKKLAICSDEKITRYKKSRQGVSP